MRKSLLYGFLLAASALALPLATHAASIPFFGPIIDPGLQTCALGWGAVLLVVNNLILFALTILIVFIAPLVIAYAGFLLVVNAVNPHGKEEARKMIANLVIGLVIALASWLIVDMIMAVLYNGTFGSWSQIINSGGGPTCLNISTQFKQAPTALVSSTGVGGNLVMQASGGGSCLVWNRGPCSTDNLTIFGAAAGQASQICSAESANGALVQGDRITPPSKDAGNPVSFGLFQINISANRVGGLNCPSAFSSIFTGSNKSIIILDYTLYEQCKFAALEPANNIAVAHALYTANGNKFGRGSQSNLLWSTAAKCNIALEAFPSLAKVCELISPT